MTFVPRMLPLQCLSRRDLLEKKVKKDYLIQEISLKIFVSLLRKKIILIKVILPISIKNTFKILVFLTLTFSYRVSHPPHSSFMEISLISDNVVTAKAHDPSKSPVTKRIQTIVLLGSEAPSFTAIYQNRKNQCQIILSLFFCTNIVTSKHYG